MKLFFQIIFLWTTISSSHCFWWMYGNNNMSECPSDLTSSAILLPDENDCQRYFACAQGRKIPGSCPDGLLFNPKVQVCDYPHNVDCPIKECPPSDVKGQTVLLPDPKNCGKFFICTHGKKVQMSCPPTLHFDPKLNVCDYPQNVRCQNANIEMKIRPTTQPICDGSKVYVPHKQDCSKFYVCSNGIPHVVTCPQGLHFDPRLNVCNWPSETETDYSQYVHPHDDLVEDDQFYYQDVPIDDPTVTDDEPFTKWLKLSTVSKGGEDVDFTGSSEPGTSKNTVNGETQEIQNNIQPSPSASPDKKPNSSTSPVKPTSSPSLLKPTPSPSTVKPTAAPTPTEEESSIGGIIENIASQLLDFFTGGDDSEEETNDEDDDEIRLRRIATKEILERIKEMLNQLADEVKENTLKNLHLHEKGIREDDNIQEKLEQPQASKN